MKYIGKLKPALIGMILVVAAVAIGCGGSDEDETTLAPLALKSCTALAGMTIAAADIGLPTQGAKIDSAVIAPAVAPFQDAEGEHLLTTPSRCLVLGKISPVDATAPPINFAMNLPLENWNRRALQSGGGGLGGALITAPGNKASGRFDPNPVDRVYPITQGYVTYGSDGGHSGPDFQFAYNAEAVRNWAHEEMKKTKDVAMAVVKAAYGEAPRRVFFSGESAGGREAVMVAQRYPNDYDGVIATSPVLLWNGIHIYDNKLRDRLIDGFLDSAAIKLVADKTRASCDAADGLTNNVVGKYMECTNDVAALRCTAGQTSGCLTDAQIASVNALRNPAPYPFTLANGITTFPGFGTTGDEDGTGFQWPFYPVGTVAPSAVLPAGRGFESGRGAILNFAAFWVRHLIVQNPEFNPRNFDVTPYQARAQFLSSLFDATNPDLAAFNARGGKLIVVHPSADNATPLTVSVDYYGSVVRKMGQEATDNVMRLYVPAGGSHNVGGTSQVDALMMLEDWVLKGKTPPDNPIAYERRVTDASLVRTRPACKYPAYPRYNGSGSTDDAANYTCVARPDLQASRFQK